MKADNEPEITAPVCFKSVKKWKYVLRKNNNNNNNKKIKGPKNEYIHKVYNGESPTADLPRVRSTR